MKNARPHPLTRPHFLAVTALALLPSCCATKRAFEEGYIAAAAEAANAWVDGMRPCTDAPPQENEVQVVGHLSDGGSEWVAEAIGCDPDALCCAGMHPTAIFIEGLDHKLTLIEQMHTPDPFGGRRRDCQWPPWKRAMQRTTVRATGTKGKYGLVVNAMCKIPQSAR
ncbi:hypothetical protein [Polyangium sp. y55x31]|uniref:hypothetical protein n=1 Tax=Polyangium sp. y55x31 TaxID=3042688 RepID=UPI0024829941|nr:hypothetical protein [Polyangium sp. y55x31]MDI1484605.1 hypothetical protein [Polyangium sp. y55x31]